MAVKQVWTSVYRYKGEDLSQHKVSSQAWSYKLEIRYFICKLLLLTKATFFVMQESLKCSDITIAI